MLHVCLVYLFAQVLADLRAVLAEVGQPDLQLLLLRRLLDPLAGVEQPGSYGSLHPAFVALLASYTTTHGGGSRLFLDSPPFAEVLQVGTWVVAYTHARFSIQIEFRKIGVCTRGASRRARLCVVDWIYGWA